MAKGLSYRELTQEMGYSVLETAKSSMKNFRRATHLPKMGEVHGPRKLPKVVRSGEVERMMGKGNIVDQYA